MNQERARPRGASVEATPEAPPAAPMDFGDNSARIAALGHAAPVRAIPLAGPRRVARTAEWEVGRGTDFRSGDGAPQPGVLGALGEAAGRTLPTRGLRDLGTAVWESAAQAGAALSDRAGRSAGDVASRMAHGAADGFVLGAESSGGVSNDASDEELFATLRREIARIGGSEGAAVVDHFQGNSGAVRVLEPGSPLSAAAAASGSFQRGAEVVSRALGERFQAQAARGELDAATVPAIADAPYIGFGEASGPLQAVIGGTQGMEVWAEHLALEPGGAWTLGTTFKIWDDFGFDASDVYSPGLLAGAILQHGRGYKAFSHVLEVPTTLHGTLTPDDRPAPAHGDHPGPAE